MRESSSMERRSSALDARSSTVRCALAALPRAFATDGVRLAAQSRRFAADACKHAARGSRLIGRSCESTLRGDGSVMSECQSMGPSGKVCRVRRESGARARRWAKGSDVRASTNKSPRRRKTHKTRRRRLPGRGANWACAGGRMTHRMREYSCARWTRPVEGRQSLREVTHLI